MSDEPIQIGVTGASGRMGRTVRETAQDRGIEVAFAVNRDAEPRLEGIEPSRRFEALCRETDPDAIVDFTGPSSTLEYVETAVSMSLPVVTGTTGFSGEQLATLETAGDDIPVLLGANFARGVQALADAVEAAVNALEEYDIELTETHHNGKRDAPSGTANMLLDRIDAVRGDSPERVHGREGQAPRSGGEIGVHARRAGDVTGEHELLLAGNQESLSLTHRAGSRSVFAEGALDAAVWLTNQPTGFYRFHEIADQLGGTA